ncbi:putative hit finger domain-containing protein [Phaeoacremonium minimum UCRPA7]|uniref:Box C/D snoRNA protein 1 n=1 Tax=Phaeoacremonium minimum (strain UCR-PA7) TaxID=1286976 RepID=R8BW84_PHAM7|nr:putative hit finger domain-containing protein [Phaeoacremonium minimum UCRPA7]EOO03641.1 putative hit finger domain-containing protein [Phaeoacremonium minimum UCRPA7]
MSSSADPLLTTLCTICHVEPPKYTCPRCAAQTCSLACSRKHKGWASCSGVRDPAAYVPAQALRTPAGIDRDYNFLSGIERERERQHRLLVEDKGLLRPADLKAGGDEKLVRKLWFGEGGARMPQQRNKRPWERHDDDGEKESFLDRKVRRRLEHMDVRVVEMPRGLSRQRENTTCWNRRTNKINWAVEWLFYDADGNQQRIRHRALETVPLCRAAVDSMAWYQKGQERAAEEEEDDEDMLHARKRRRVLIREIKEERRSAPLGAMQDWDGEQGTWLSTHYPTQNPFTAAWDLDRGSIASNWVRDEEADEKRRSHFFLLKPLTPAGQPKELIPLESAETLAQALPGRTVLEFPTIYVLPPSASLPEGHVVGSTERRERPRRPERPQVNGGSRSGPREKYQGAGSKQGQHVRNGRGGMQKKVAFADEPTKVERGEVNSEEKPPEEEDITSSEPETTSDEDSSGGSEGEASGQEDVVQMPKRMGLVDYASDSESTSEEGDDRADLDVSTLNPENPELVRGAIAEIVNLFT